MNREDRNWFYGYAVGMGFGCLVGAAALNTADNQQFILPLTVLSVLAVVMAFYHRHRLKMEEKS